MERQFLPLASLCEEFNGKGSGETIFIELSFIMETVLI